MQYKILFTGKAYKDLKMIPQKWKSKIIEAIEGLIDEPFIGKKLEGPLRGLYSLRVWPYRVIYQIRKKEVTILIVHIGHRQGVYQ